MRLRASLVTAMSKPIPIHDLGHGYTARYHEDLDNYGLYNPNGTVRRGPEIVPPDVYDLFMGVRHRWQRDRGGNGKERR